MLGEAGIPRDTEAGRQEFAQRMELGRAGKEPEDYERLRRGWCLWCLGSESFRGSSGYFRGILIGVFEGKGRKRGDLLGWNLGWDRTGERQSAILEQ